MPEPTPNKYIYKTHHSFTDPDNRKVHYEANLHDCQTSVHCTKEVGELVFNGTVLTIYASTMVPTEMVRLKAHRYDTLRIIKKGKG